MFGSTISLGSKYIGYGLSKWTFNCPFCSTLKCAFIMEQQCNFPFKNNSIWKPLWHFSSAHIQCAFFNSHSWNTKYQSCYQFWTFQPSLVMRKVCNVCDLTLRLNHNLYINGHWLNACDILKKTCCFLPTNIVDNIFKGEKKKIVMLCYYRC